MPRQSYRERALVVRTYDFGEADRIIVLLTRGRGIVRGVAKGVRRTRSRFGSRLQRFVLLDVECYEGRNLASVTQADTVDYLASGIIDDYARYTAACAVLEAAERLSLQHLSDPVLFDACHATLCRIRAGGNPTLHLDTFLLHAMAHAGWAPSLFDCAQCGAPGPHKAFHPASGGAVCTQCRSSGSVSVDPQVLRLMWWVANDRESSVERLCYEHPDVFETLVDDAHQLVGAHVQWQLERALHSLRAHEGAWVAQ